MPGAVGNPPGILSPGRGPNGPGPIDMRRPETSVGARSSVPYGPTLGYATPNGVTGFVGPAAGALQKPTSWYVRVGGSNSNGGSSASLAAERTGTDGATAQAVFTSASASFTSADVGKGICVINVANNFRKIVSVTNSTTVVLNAATSGGNASGLTWAIGGAWADPRAILADTAVGSTTSGHAVQAGDTAYIGAGTYRVTILAGAAGGSAWNAAFNGVVNIVGDVDGSHTGDAGMVQLTAYTTNDKTAPSATTLLNLNGKSNLAFSNIMFVGGSATMVTATTATSQNITFRDCAFLPQSTASVSNVTMIGGFGVPLAWMVDRCFFAAQLSASARFTITLTTGNGSSDYDTNWTCQNSIFVPSTGAVFNVTNSGTLTFKGGGVRARNITATGIAANLMATAASQISTVFPCAVYECFVTDSSVALNAGTSGQIVEDYNVIVAATPRTNVSTGAHSVSDGSYASLYHFGQERIWGALLRPFGEPMAGSPLLGFGSQDPAANLGNDLYNRLRPAGGGALPYPAVGALERGNTWIADTAPIGTGASAIKIAAGPGYSEFLVPVPALAVTISCLVAWDANYAGTKPQLQLDANGRIGVSAQTVTAVGSGSAETLTLAAFTPTAAGGMVRVRVISNDRTGLSVVQADNFSVTAS